MLRRKGIKNSDRNINVPLFAISEKMLLHDERIRRSRSAKLNLPFIGPYEILAVEDVNVTLKLPRNKTLRVHCNRQTLFWLNCRNGTQTGLPACRK